MNISSLTQYTNMLLSLTHNAYSQFNTIGSSLEVLNILQFFNIAICHPLVLFYLREYNTHTEDK